MTTSFVGTTVQAKVTRVEEYALYLEANEMPIVVLIPDVSAEPVHLKDAWRVGDSARVKILRYVEQEALYKGSIKDADTA